METFFSASAPPRSNADAVAAASQQDDNIAEPLSRLRAFHSSLKVISAGKR
jgi:hypothetical protein